MEVHPICALLPEHSHSEYASLVDSIRQQGLVNPITTYEGKILDGRHRFRACMDAGETPRFTEYLGTDPVGFVQASCVHRNLSTSQRALIAAGFLEYERQQAKVRQQANLKHGDKAPVKENLPEREQGQGQSRDKAGARMGVSGKSVAAAEAVLTHGTESIVQLVRAGEMTVSEAKHVSTLGKPAQERIAAAPKRERSNTIQVACARSESRMQRHNRTPAVLYPGTPFVRKLLSGIERVGIVCAEDGTKESADIVSRFMLEMDWDSQPLLMQLARCEPIIDAMAEFKHRRSKANH